LVKQIIEAAAIVSLLKMVDTIGLKHCNPVVISVAWPKGLSRMSFRSVVGGVINMEDCETRVRHFGVEKKLLSIFNENVFI
jgi:predicted nucleotidyltransferase